MATQLERSQEFRKCNSLNSDGKGTNDDKVIYYKYHKYELEVRLQYPNLKSLATTD